MNKWQIESLLKDYHWKLHSVRIMRESVGEVNSNLTAQYGLEAAMPKAKSNPSDPILKEVERRDKRWKKVSAYERDIQFVQARISLVTDERESEVLHWLLEGKSMRWIGLHMGLSDKHIGRIKDRIVSHMSHMSDTSDKCIC